MTRASTLPRLAREGWVPAGPDKRVNKRAMLIPKTHALGLFRVDMPARAPGLA